MRLVVLGSTGSIGRAALEVAEGLGDVGIVGLSARANVDLLAVQARRWRPRAVAVIDPAAAARVQGDLPPGVRLLVGADGLLALASMPEVDMVLVAVVGASGLPPTLAALAAGHDVALANKEALVAGGALVTAARERSGARLLPVDSEHSAIFQCLAGQDRAAVRRLILTASGGPFLRRPLHDLRSATVEEALAHPTWNMGPKVTIDSATLMNKGLEIIEAHWLFGVAAAQIEVVIHPQSLVHSMVEFIDGSTIMQAGVPDMRGPIQYALTAPRRRPGPVRPLEWSRLHLTFEQPDPERFPALALARRALERGGVVPAVLNAANEVAVAKFLQRTIRFPEIIETVAEVLERCEPRPADSLESVLDADAWARREADRVIGTVR
ncbi:MAG: 1-deoxy-D-xylulose-5-phosphate reductoisomerase [Armatimonadota bacterium]|nr:1-deoxy-D-xylulose-5-phosphate reductoisomerase [Armatimonadota bacterium]MDR7519457.1 1-deoxy-D-xylulose-5-phosphate reductoisomerase [Armatimonadota bacterium]